MTGCGRRKEAEGCGEAKFGPSSRSAEPQPQRLFIVSRGLAQSPWFLYDEVQGFGKEGRHGILSDFSFSFKVRARVVVRLEIE